MLRRSGFSSSSLRLSLCYVFVFFLGFSFCLTGLSVFPRLLVFFCDFSIPPFFFFADALFDSSRISDAQYSVFVCSCLCVHLRICDV